MKYRIHRWVSRDEYNLLLLNNVERREKLGVII